ncbi:MAG: hypothetical protein AAGD96_10285 [Chloroflexota bacterium]
MDQMLKILIGSWAGIVLLAGIVGFSMGSGDTSTEVAADDTFLPITAMATDKTKSSTGDNHQAFNRVGFEPETKGVLLFDEADAIKSNSRPANVVKFDPDAGTGTHSAFNQVKFELAENESRPHQAFNTVRYQHTE